MSALDVRPTRDPEARRLLSAAHDLALELEDLNRQLARQRVRQDFAALVDGERGELERLIEIRNHRFVELRNQLKRYGTVCS